MLKTLFGVTSIVIYEFENAITKQAYPNENIDDAAILQNTISPDALAYVMKAINAKHVMQAFATQTQFQPAGRGENKKTLIQRNMDICFGEKQTIFTEENIFAEMLPGKTQHVEKVVALYNQKNPTTPIDLKNPEDQKRIIIIEPSPKNRDQLLERYANITVIQPEVNMVLGSQVNNGKWLATLAVRFDIGIEKAPKNERHVAATSQAAAHAADDSPLIPKSKEGKHGSCLPRCSMM